MSCYLDSVDETDVENVNGTMQTDTSAVLSPTTQVRFIETLM